MRRSRMVVLLLATLGFAGPKAPAAPEQAAADPVHHLIAQLGSPKFAEREAASQALDVLGARALPLLHQAADDVDPEVRRRARALARRIARRIETEQILAGQRLRLVYKNALIAEAVADLRKKTGLPVELEDDGGKLAERRITLDTGTTTLWKAYEQFCDKAGLGEPGPAAGGRRVASSGSELELERRRRQILLRRQELMEGYVSEPQASGRMVLVDGKSHALPTSLAGAVRIRALAPRSGAESRPAGPGERVLGLEVTPEPRMQWQAIINVRVDKAVDDLGQSLSQALGHDVRPPGPPGANAIVLLETDESGRLVTHARHVPIRLKASKQPSKVLKELKGTVAAQVQTPSQPLLTVDDVLNRRAKKEVTNDDGDTLKILGVDRPEDDLVKLHIQLTSASPNGVWNGNRIIRRRVVRGGRVLVTQENIPGSRTSLALKDAKGRELRLVSTHYRLTMRNFNSFTQEVELTYEQPTGQGAPATFVYSGPRTVIIDVPFLLKNVPLP